ncbi:hypothetical protein D3C80_1914300 [compost metagenome]
MEAHRATIDQCFDVDIRSAVHLTTEAELGIFLSAGDAGLCFTQRSRDLFGVVTNRGYDPHTRYDHTPHRVLLYT